MLVAYKPDYQKITMGLLSLIPDFKETQYLTAEMDRYLKEEHRHLFIWRSEETKDMVGVIGVEEEQGLLLLRHIALNPSYRDEGITYEMLNALSETFPNNRIMGTIETASLVSKWQQTLTDKNRIKSPSSKER